MDGNELKKITKKWASTVEYRYAYLALVNGGLSSSLAEFLIKGTYRSTPKGETVDKLTRVLKREGALKAS